MPGSWMSWGSGWRKRKSEVISADGAAGSGCVVIRPQCLVMEGVTRLVSSVVLCN